MKRCPKCDFSFASFHHVCDFDGTDLIDDPETLPVSPGVSALVVSHPVTISPSGKVSRVFSSFGAGWSSVKRAADRLFRCRKSARLVYRKSGLAGFPLEFHSKSGSSSSNSSSAPSSSWDAGPFLQPL